MLAHTFFPAPPNPEPIAGDMHFDDSETLAASARTRIYSASRCMSWVTRLGWATPTIPRRDVSVLPDGDGVVAAGYQYRADALRGTDQRACDVDHADGNAHARRCSR